MDISRPIKRMAGLAKEGVLRLNWTPSLQFVRGRRVNVQRPRPPHYQRALTLALLRPQYDLDLEKTQHLPNAETCKKVEELGKYKTRPDNPLEKILARELKENFDTKKLVAFLHANSVAGEDLFDAKVKLKKENMTLEVHSKYTVKLAVTGTRYEAIMPLFVAHNAIIFCDEPKVGKLIKILKKIPHCILMAGMVEGRLLSVTGLQSYAALGDVTTAQAQLVATLSSVGSSLVTRLNQAQTTLVSQLNQIAEQKGKPDS